MRIDVELELDRHCWACDGGQSEPTRGWVAEDGTCKQCDGTGREITDQGKIVIEFLKRHGIVAR